MFKWVWRSGCLGVEAKYTDTFSGTARRPAERIDTLVEATGLFAKEGGRK